VVFAKLIEFLRPARYCVLVALPMVDAVAFGFQSQRFYSLAKSQERIAELDAKLHYAFRLQHLHQGKCKGNVLDPSTLGRNA